MASIGQTKRAWRTPDAPGEKSMDTMIYAVAKVSPDGETIEELDWNSLTRNLFALKAVKLPLPAGQRLIGVDVAERVASGDRQFINELVAQRDEPRLRSPRGKLFNIVTDD